MKSTRAQRLIILAVALLALAIPGITAENESIYGHVSFVENQATIIRADQEEQKAVVNLPLVPGDTILTGSDGRCELQFDNGTVIRLDENSRLRITTLQAPTLTSRWNITTLHLLQGQMYALPQTYGMEVFQVITPNAAVKLASRTKATIRFDAELRTTLFSDAGKFEALYGDDRRALKTIKVKAGQAYVIDANNVLNVSSEKRNLEFVAWNDYVDRHFKELHFGISKVPPKLKFGNTALRYWAEKWSSRFGEWTYDELFGYVWKPAAEQFANSARPFFHADRVRINGQLFLVPQESWGWAPAHMGTWVWLNRGWTWIPGDWFHSGVVDFLGISTFPTMDYYYIMGYGYQLFQRYGLQGWRLDYLRRYYQEVWEQIRESWINRTVVEAKLRILPDKLAGIIKRANKGSAEAVAKRLGLTRHLPVLGKDKLLPDNGAKRPVVVPDAADNARPLRGLETKNGIRRTGGNKALRDWNPDSRWAAGRGVTIQYSSSRNAVLCPEMNISSDRDRLQNRSASGRSLPPPRGETIGSSTPAAADTSSGAENTHRPAATDDRAGKKEDPRK